MFGFLKRGPEGKPKNVTLEPELELEDFVGEVTAKDETEIQRIFSRAGLSISKGDILKITEKKDPEYVRERRVVGFANITQQNKGVSPYNIVLDNGIHYTIFNLNEINDFTVEIIQKHK